MQTVDVLIHGTGVVGRALALCMAQLGLRVAMPWPANGSAIAPADDVRAYALNAASVALLRELRIWDALPSHAVTPVYDMHIHGDAHAALQFSAWEQGLSELAWIVDVPSLENALATALRFSPQIELLPPEAAWPTAAVEAICEGKHSAQRALLRGLEVKRVDYGQTAIAARLSSPFAHAGVAHQWFRSPDVLALLPCSAGPQAEPAYSLVWSLPTQRARELMALSESAFETDLAQALPERYGVGDLKLISRRAAWPLARTEVSSWAGSGWILLGDAAHTVHPLAGQGLNLGLADVAALKKVFAQREAWRPLGDVKLLRRYERQRLLPTQLMGDLTGGLMHLFSNSHGAVSEIRNRGMMWAQALPGVKRWLVARALG